MTKTPALKQFERQIEGIGHPEYPFLHKTYSTSSNIPCTDLVPFIENRFRVNDLTSIKQVMYETIRANPGLGIGFGKTKDSQKFPWIDDWVENVAKLNFRRYVKFDDNKAFYRLKALFTVAAKNGTNKEFWIKDEIPQLFSWCLCAFLPVWRRNIRRLLRRGNKFIDKKAKKCSFWAEYPRFKREDALPPNILRDEIVDKVQTLSPAACMHLLYAVSRLRPGEIWHKRGGNAISDLTNYAVRSFGINIPETSVEILNTGLLINSSEPRALLFRRTKKDLIKACEASGVHFRKSWRKAKIFDALQSGDPEFVKRELEQLDLVIINPDYKNGLLILADYAEELTIPFKLLCFI